MKIVSSQVAMASSHQAVQRRAVSQSLQIAIGRPQAVQSAQSSPSQGGKCAGAGSSGEDQLDMDPRLVLLQKLIERLLGHKIRLLSANDFKSRAGKPQFTAPSGNSAASVPSSAGFSVKYDRHESNYEAETTQFASQGVVTTADGKTIAFNVGMQMSREFASTDDVQLRLGDAAKTKDPLVLNFGGSAAQLTDAKFSFDLDSDGNNENISFVQPGSGFLVLDKNGNGQADNGSELFGAASGNGFADLATYDTDHNSWIDENDAVFSGLRVWTKDASGADQLSTLKEVGVGAINLGNVDTQFSLKDASNGLQGVVRSTGVFLGENGGAGTVQQVDLAV